MSSRESIYAALFAKLTASAGFTTTSRRLKHWEDVSAADQPALFQAQRGEVAQAIPGQPVVWTLQVDVYLYAHTNGDRTVAPAQILNPLLDAALATLAPDPITNKCRLGGLVEHAWVEGRVETDEGVLGDQGVAIIPITMKVIF